MPDDTDKKIRPDGGGSLPNYSMDDADESNNLKNQSGAKIVIDPNIQLGDNEIEPNDTS